MIAQCPVPPPKWKLRAIPHENQNQSQTPCAPFSPETPPWPQLAPDSPKPNFPDTDGSTKASHTALTQN